MKNDHDTYGTSRTHGTSRSLCPISDDRAAGSDSRAAEPIIDSHAKARSVHEPPAPLVVTGQGEYARGLFADGGTCHRWRRLPVRMACGRFVEVLQ